jgi:hypothetical protein
MASYPFRFCLQCTLRERLALLRERHAFLREAANMKDPVRGPQTRSPRRSPTTSRRACLPTCLPTTNPLTYLPIWPPLACRSARTLSTLSLPGFPPADDMLMIHPAKPLYSFVHHSSLEKEKEKGREGKGRERKGWGKNAVHLYTVCSTTV